MDKGKIQVHFIGAGPGDPELLTIKGQRCIKEADLVLYAGSLVPRESVACAKETARIVDSSSMTLEQTHAEMLETVRAGGTVARVHTGDPSLYGAIKEQMLLLDKEGIGYEVVPGVTAAFAAAAAAKISFTLPEKVQTLILSRMEGRTPVPDRERLRDLSKHGAALAIYLSAANPDGLVEELLAGGYPGETPVVLAYRVGLARRTDCRHQNFRPFKGREGRQYQATGHLPGAAGAKRRSGFLQAVQFGILPWLPVRFVG